MLFRTSEFLKKAYVDIHEACSRTYANICICLPVFVCFFVCVCVSVCVCVCVCVYVSVSMCQLCMRLCVPACGLLRACERWFLYTWASLSTRAGKSSCALVRTTIY